MEMLRGHGVNIQYPVSIPRAEDVWPSLVKIMCTSTITSRLLDMANNTEEHEFTPPIMSIYRTWSTPKSTVLRN